MNSSTIAGYFGAPYISGVLQGNGRNQLLQQTLVATETEFVVGTEAGSTIALLSIPSGSGKLGSVAPLDYSDNAALPSRTGRTWGIPSAAGSPPHGTQAFDFGRPFLIRAAGVVTPVSDAGNSLTFVLYYGSTKLGTSLAATAGMTGTESSVAAGAFILEAQLQWDSVGGRLGGQFWYQVLAGATESYHTWAATSYISSATLAGANFCISAHWGAAAGGVIQPSEFSLSQL